MFEKPERLRGHFPAPSRRRWSAALAGVLWLAAIAAAAPPEQSSQQSNIDTVTIQAKRDRALLQRRVDKFVSGITRVPFQDSLAQWQKEIPICFAIAGMTREYGEYTLFRLSQIAEASGAPLAPAKCKPNFFVIATAVPDELIAAWSKHDPGMFRDGGAKKIHQFATASTPISAWYNVALYNQDGTPCIPSMIPGLEGVPLCHGVSHLMWAAVRDLSSVIVLIDTRRTKGITFDQLAAYVAMIGLAEIRANVKVGDAPTILRLFTDSAHAPANGMSLWDTAYLKALYHTEHRSKTQLLALAKSMVNDVAP